MKYFDATHFTIIRIFKKLILCVKAKCRNIKNFPAAYFGSDFVRQNDCVNRKSMQEYVYMAFTIKNEMKLLKAALVNIILNTKMVGWLIDS